MEQQLTVLVVDDDPTIAELMRDFLEAAAFRVYLAEDALHAMQQLREQAIDCLLLDIMLPGQSGFDLCRQIRESSDMPILFLSARDEDMAKIRGLGMGGDDYIVKSATPAEVVARVQAVMRRYQKGAVAPSVQLDFGRLKIDLRAHEVWVDSQPVAFSPREFELLLHLAEHPRQLFTAEQLLDRFWEGVGDRHTVTVHIGRIREKIEENPREPLYIVTVWGVGYRFEGQRR